MTIQENIKAVLTFRNGTELELFEDSIISASVKQQCCADGKFEIGGVYAAQLSIKCKVPGTNSFRIRGAKIQVFSKYSNEQDFISRGIFWITSAVKTGEIYSVTAVDNIGWLDTSSYNDSQANILENFIDYFRNLHPNDATLYTWFHWLTQEMNSIISRMTGLSSILSWKDYDEIQNGNFCNQYYTDTEHPAPGVELKYYIEIAGHSGNPDVPREIYKRLAEITGGFIYAYEDGRLTLGQFGQAEFGIALISDSEIELDSFEPSDFRVVVAQIGADSRIAPGDAIGTGNPPQPEDVYYYFTVDNNIFMDGFADLYIIGTGQPADLHFNTLLPIAKGIFYYLYHSEIRPFKCKVHKAERFHLGQKIQINNFESIITSIQWTFRGGYTLACGGEDSRTLSGCTRYSKSDKSLMMCTVLEKRISSLESRIS